MACPKSLYRENLKLRNGETTCLAAQSAVPGLAASASPSVCLLVWVALGLRCCTRCCSSCSECGLFFVAVHELLSASGFSWSVGSRVHGLQQSQPVGLVDVAHGLSCSPAYGLFLDPGSNPALAGGFLSTEPPGKTI